MQTRREQVRAYRFVNRRMVSALLSGDPENQDLPMRRLGLAIFGSVMVAAIIFAVVGIYGIYNPGGGKLDDDTLVIEKETGATFVYRSGILFPVANFTSGRLVIGVPDPKKQTVSANTLRGRQRGPMVGIANAPDTLPPAKAMVDNLWSVCAAPTINGGVVTQVMVGSTLPGGTRPGDRSLYVRAGSGSYLVAGDHRYRVKDDQAVRTALQLNGVTPVPIADPVLNAIPSGPVLESPTITSKDDAAPSAEGKALKYGEVVVAGDQFYVVLTDGYAKINLVTKNLLTTKVSNTLTTLSVDTVSKRPSTQKVEPEGWLPDMPNLVDTAGAKTVLCATYDGRGKTAALTVTYFPQVPPGMTTTPASQSVQDNHRLADRMVIEGGRGALVQRLPVLGSSSTGTTIYLITDGGYKYALATSGLNAQSVLGYGDVTPVLVPADLLDLVRDGPVLDADAAHTELLRASAA